MLCRWEVFEDGPITAPEDRLHASLSARNDLLLNGNILERLGNPEAVLLMFDRLNEIIGVNPCPPTLPNAFPLKTRKTGRHRIIHATPFCKRFGIRVDATTTFLTPEIDEDGVLRLDLRAIAAVPNRPHRPKRS